MGIVCYINRKVVSVVGWKNESRDTICFTDYYK